MMIDELRTILRLDKTSQYKLEELVQFAEHGIGISLIASATWTVLEERGSSLHGSNWPRSTHLRRSKRSAWRSE